MDRVPRPCGRDPARQDPRSRRGPTRPPISIEQPRPGWRQRLEAASPAIRRQGPRDRPAAIAASGTFAGFGRGRAPRSPGQARHPQGRGQARPHDAARPDPGHDVRCRACGEICPRRWRRARWCTLCRSRARRLPRWRPPSSPMRRPCFAPGRAVDGGDRRDGDAENRAPDRSRGWRCSTPNPLAERAPRCGRGARARSTAPCLGVWTG